MSGRRDLAIGVAVLAASFAVTFALFPWNDERVSDLFVYAGDASQFVHGALPYRDVFFEYPPLAAPVMALPGLFGDYRIALAIEMFLLAACLLPLVRALARWTGGDERVAMAAVAMSPLLTGALIRNHFDLAPIVLTVAAVALIARSRAVAGFGVLGLAVTMKGFPLVVAPVALAWLVARGERRAALHGAACLLAVSGFFAGLAIGISPSGALDGLHWQTDRPVQVESIAAVVLRVTGANAEHVQSFRSDGLVHPAAGTLAALIAGLGVGAVALLALRAARSPGRRELVLASLGAVTAFAAFGKVLSPQYVIWTLPLLALAFAWRMRVLAYTLTGATVLTLAYFPVRYFEVVAGDQAAVAVVACRDALLVVAVGAVVAALGATRTEPAAARSSALGRRLPLRSERR